MHERKSGCISRKQREYVIASDQWGVNGCLSRRQREEDRRGKKWGDKKARRTAKEALTSPREKGTKADDDAGAHKGAFHHRGHPLLVARRPPSTPPCPFIRLPVQGGCVH